MIDFLKGRKIVLGSKSPRRSELLDQAGLPYSIRLKEVEEIYPNDMDKRAVPEYLAVLKAQPLLSTLTDDEILITADCVVLWNNLILGKPKTIKEAKKTLRSLSNNMHEVISGVNIQSKTKQVRFSASAEVEMAALSDDEIEYYVHHFSPMDKAGSYGIQEWIGYCKVKSIKGTFATIMGMPIDRVYEELKIF